MTLAELETLVRMTVTPGGLRTDDKDWEHYHFDLEPSVLGTPTRRMTTVYRMGIGHAKKSTTYLRGTIIPPKPVLMDVLESLSSDASCAQGTFEDFCGDLGYDTDSRKALEIYLACQKSGSKLRKLLGGKYGEVQAFVDEANQ